MSAPTVLGPDGFAADKYRANLSLMISILKVRKANLYRMPHSIDNTKCNFEHEYLFKNYLEF